MSDYNLTAANEDYIGRMNLIDIQADMHLFGETYPSSGLGAEFLRERIDRDEALIVTGESGELFGFMAFEIIPSMNYCYIHQVTVAPEQQRKGIAQSIFACAIQKAKDKGCEVLGLTTTLDAPWGVNLYKKIGFVQKEISTFDADMQAFIKQRLGYKPETKGYFELKI